MDDGITAIIFIIIAAILFIGGCWVGDRHGYRKAYEDMNHNKIEQVVQKEYPDLWIKYNIKQKKEIK